MALLVKLEDEAQVQELGHLGVLLKERLVLAPPSLPLLQVTTRRPAFLLHAPLLL